MIDEHRVAEIAGTVAATVAVRIAEAEPEPTLSVEAFDRIVDVAVAESVAITRRELNQLRTELLESVKVSTVERDAAGNIFKVTTTSAA